jgi:galactokinase/mevalonate kinase-like predicted kinase
LLAATLACVLSIRSEKPEANVSFAELVRDIEFNEAGIVCGYQDAYMAVHGGLQAMEFVNKHPIEGGPHGKLQRLTSELPFLLITTGVERLSGSVHGPIRERWLKGDSEVVKGMKHIGELGRAGTSALEKSDWKTLGKAMDENHEIVASLGGSGVAIDSLIEDCRKEGAISAKLAGAGLGGTVIALTEDANELESRLKKRGYSRFLRPSIEEGLRCES